MVNIVKVILHKSDISPTENWEIEVDLDSLINRLTDRCGKFSKQGQCSGYGYVVYCDNKIDIWRCWKCGYMWKAPCNFEEDYS